MLTRSSTPLDTSNRWDIWHNPPDIIPSCHFCSEKTTELKLIPVHLTEQLICRNCLKHYRRFNRRSHHE